MTHKYFLRSRTRFISESSEGNSSESSENSSDSANMGEDNNQGNSVTVQLSTAENSVPLFRGGRRYGEIDYSEGVSLDSFIDSLETYFQTANIKDEDRIKNLYKFVDKRRGDGSITLAHFLQPEYTNWTWEQVKGRLRLIYPSDESRNYQKGMDRLLFDIQFEGQLHPLNVDKLRKAVNSIVRLYLEHSDSGNVIDGNATGLPVKEILTSFVGNILTARIFSSFCYNKVMEKCSNQADLDELTSTLMSVINNCPPGKEIYKGMGQERKSEAQIQQLSKESKNSERNGQRESNRYQNREARQQFSGTGNRKQGASGSGRWKSNNQSNSQNRNRQSFYKKNNEAQGNANYAGRGNNQGNSTDKKNIKCFNCGKMGHYARECRTRNVRQMGNEEQ